MLIPEPASAEAKVPLPLTFTSSVETTPDKLAPVIVALVNPL